VPQLSAVHRQLVGKATSYLVAWRATVSLFLDTISLFLDTVSFLLLVSGYCFLVSGHRFPSFSVFPCFFFFGFDGGALFFGRGDASEWFGDRCAYRELGIRIGRPNLLFFFFFFFF